jgi:deoxyhypusine synthase
LTKKSFLSIFNFVKYRWASGGKKEMARHPHLTRPVQPLMIQPQTTAAQLLRSMGQTAFQGKNLSVAAQIWAEMIKQKVTILLGVAGALIPAGMRQVLVYAIQNRMIDCLVSTGANLFHDIHETLGRNHWQGSCGLDDVGLKKAGIDRIYDVFASEKEFTQADEYILSWSRSLKPRRPFTTREFFSRLGEQLLRDGRRDGILTSAFGAGVPVYCPAIADSSVGIALAKDTKGPAFLFDLVGDVRETAYIVARSKATGVIFLGGGTPKNFIQQTEVTANFLGLKVSGHRYAIQVTTDAPHWGGLSGCTFEEAQSWGKISEKAEKITVYCDSTIALPLIVTAVAQESEATLPGRTRPEMEKLRLAPGKRRVQDRRKSPRR